MISNTDLCPPFRYVSATSTYLRGKQVAEPALPPTLHSTLHLPSSMHENRQEGWPVPTPTGGSSLPFPSLQVSPLAWTPPWQSAQWGGRFPPLLLHLPPKLDMKTGLIYVIGTIWAFFRAATNLRGKQVAEPALLPYALLIVHSTLHLPSSIHEYWHWTPPPSPLAPSFPPPKRKELRMDIMNIKSYRPISASLLMLLDLDDLWILLCFVWWFVECFWVSLVDIKKCFGFELISPRWKTRSISKFSSNTLDIFRYTDTCIFTYCIEE